MSALGTIVARTLVGVSLLGLLTVGALPAHAQLLEGAAFHEVTPERLLAADAEPQNWLMYSGNYSSQRHSRLDQINRSNVSGLEMQWAYQLGAMDLAETTPVVVDGVMFVTEPTAVVALDAATGGRYWRHEYAVADQINLCCGRNNRGVAVLGERVYTSTLDAHLLALDAKTGALAWDVEVGDAGLGYSKTAAPLVVGDKIITGIAGGEYGIRGFLDAYDAETGAQVWRLYTVPEPGHPDNATWAGESWRIGGAPTWLTGSYDPELDLVYWGTGNPAPDWNGASRLGDNLYASSVLAVRPQTGELQWHFQFTPHDEHDWDATQIPLLADAPFGGRDRKLLMTLNRNAFFYVLDRETGQFLLGEPFVRQTWAERLDENGRPVRAPNKTPTVEGTLVSPAVQGATNWWSTSYSPQTGLVYAMTFDGETVFYSREDEYVPGESYTGGGGAWRRPIEEYVSALKAISPQTGKVVWSYEVRPRTQAGALSTAGELVFGGTVDGYFFALDARTGEELWHVNLGAEVRSAPMSYAVGGKQYVAIAAGNVLFTFALR